MRVSGANEEFNSLSNRIQQIADMYFVALRHVESCEEINGLRGTLVGFVAFINKVKNAYYQLDDLEKIFINNDFFYEEYPNWWKPIYSKSTYYRLKKRSMKRFKEAFDNEK